MPKKKSLPRKTEPIWPVYLVCAGLALAVWLIYGQTLGFEFVNYDDHVYVYENPVVTQGLTWHGIIWAFTQSHGTNWHPLTSLTHLLDGEFYGLHAGGHHFTNVLLHALAAILLFLVLRRLTKTFWRSAFVAALFAVHPLHVESVAWISERKDVLSAVFFAVTLGAYLRYVARPARGTYLLLAFTFALALMTKPMLVTLPFLLLLLDYWPLARFDEAVPSKGKSKPVSWWEKLAPRPRLFLEKVPLLFLATVSCVVTSLVQKEAMSSFDRLPVSLRVANAIISYVTYLRQMFWPTGLAAFYPYPGRHLPLVESILAGLFLAAITTAAVIFRKRCRYFFVGWFWYLGMLVPVIGLVQVGSQAHADRYTYLPQIGLYLIVAWAGVAAAAYLPQLRRGLVGIAVAALLVLTFGAWRETASWRDSEALWERSLAVTEDNELAHRNLGSALLQKGKVNDAIAQDQIAVDEISGPQSNTAESNFNPGRALVGKSDRAGVIARYVALVNLANALVQGGRFEEAIRRFQQAIALLPDHPQAFNSLATAYMRKGRLDDAIHYFEKATEVAPDSAVTQNNLAWILATRSERNLREGARAVELASRAEKSTSGKEVVILHTLAAAYAQNNQFPQAIEAARKALELAQREGKQPLADEIARELALYEGGRSWQEPR